MKITTLMENTIGNKQCFFEHGLSLYIETNKHTILFDTGQSIQTIQNAKILDVDLKKVDIVILSHGHYDHSGALLEFASINPDATIYMKKQALELHYHGDKYIGIDERIKDLNIQLLQDDLIIDDELSLYTNVTERKYFWKGNYSLSKRIEGKDLLDDFQHEQNLVIKENNHAVLFGGCAHNGIINILNKYDELYDVPLHTVISGFHLKKSSDYTIEEINQIKDIGNILKERDCIYYTGHCTGLFAYDILKDIMKDQLHYLHSGDIVEL